MFRALNAPGPVNREARLRIQKFVREPGSTRNGAARALGSRRSRMVGVVLPTLRQPIQADVVGTFQDGIEQIAVDWSQLIA